MAITIPQIEAIKRGDTFSLNFEFLDKTTGAAKSLAGHTIRSQARTVTDPEVVLDATVTVTNSAGGLATLKYSSTEDLPVSAVISGTIPLYLDIEVTRTSDGFVDSTQTVNSPIVRDITEPAP